MNMKVVIFPILILASLFSCAKDGVEKDAGLHDSIRVAQSVDSVLREAIRLGDTTNRPDPMPGSSEIPVGQLPLLHSSVLAQFHPNPEGFNRYRSLAYDSAFVRAESVSFFKDKGDSARILRCIIVDQNEQTANSLIKEIIEIKRHGFREFDVSGTKVKAYYTEIKGMPAIHGHNPVKNVATLNILCGDHRLVLFREDKASSTEHLLSVAKTMDLQRLSEMVPQ